MKPLHVITGEDHVTIADDDGFEVVHWTEDEWQEDPALAPAIASACALAIINPRGLIEGLFGGQHMNWEIVREARSDPNWKDEINPEPRWPTIEQHSHDEEMKCPGCNYRFMTTYSLTSWDEDSPEGYSDGNCAECLMEQLSAVDSMVVNY